MGCFLGCFGFSTKRKRRKPAKNVVPRDQKHLSYKPLDSFVSINHDITDNPICSHSELRNKLKEQSSIKVKKKVSFNLNVQAYEPVPNDGTTYHSWGSDEQAKKEETIEETVRGSQFPLQTKGYSAALRMGSYPSNYRYQNSVDSYDEEDEMAFEESDLDDEFEDDDLIGDQRTSQEEFSKEFNSLSMDESQKIDSLANDKTNNHLPPCSSTYWEMKSIGLNRSARDRSQYVHSVLNPVENLTQWKAVKAKAAPPKQQRKENIAAVDLPLFNAAPNGSQSRPLLPYITVDSSLSNWLASSYPEEYEIESLKSSSVTLKAMPSLESMFERSYSWRSRQGIPILDMGA
ncbi:hypothetical protein CFOL_v3_30521 [Cephalotus follicularis]|uniref:Uncharacterized protein n=1 Tax=Cephalotus follicularis TaxID=3775 RepID=A0A1Q3D3Q5_CEPFO|nr:hypothetical protein CFOL_v3_30521 [Cephalotus follicularis]